MFTVRQVHDMDDMLEDAFSFHRPNETGGLTQPQDGPDTDANAFFDLVEDMNEPLYAGYEEFSTLSFIVLLYHAKYLYGVTDVAFNAYVKLFKEALPKGNTLPSSCNKVKSIIKKLGLGYNNIDACLNDCVLFGREFHLR